MSNNKLDATFHGREPEINPGVVVHIEVLYTAVCHKCGWEGTMRYSDAIADYDAREHRCNDA